MKDSYESAGGLTGDSTQWDDLKNQVPSPESAPASPAHETTDVERNAKYTDYLKDKLSDIDSRGQDYQFKHAAEAQEMRAQIKAMDPVEQARTRAVEQARQEQIASEHAANQAELQQIDQMRAREAHRDNLQQYGSDIPATTARNGFNTEYYALKRKYDKIKRLQAKEAEMPSQERAKSEHQREKKGLAISSEEVQHLNELREMQELGGHQATEEYGRRKEMTYRKIIAAKSAHPWQFRKVIKREKLEVPKKWDDPSYSLDDLRKIAFQTEHLLQDE